MGAALLPDPLWDLVEPFLPAPPRRPKGGRPPVSDRACLTGILFVLRSGIPWQMLAQELRAGGALCVVPRTGAGWAGGGGWSSGRLHGSTSSDACASATTSGPTSTRGSPAQGGRVFVV